MQGVKKILRILCLDKVGLIAEVSELLMKHNININNIEAQNYAQQAVLQLNVDEHMNDTALSVLTKAGYHTVSDEVVLICIDDKPGSLAIIARQLTEEHVEIKGITSMHRSDGKAIVVLNTNNNDKTRQILASFLA
jgi:hypothetical protein